MVCRAAVLAGRAGDAAELLDVLGEAWVGRQLHGGEEVVGGRLLCAGAEAEERGGEAALFADAAADGLEEDAGEARWEG